MKDSIVSATLDVYQRVMAQLLPTPTKSHYTFNLRDIRFVFPHLQSDLITKAADQFSRSRCRGALALIHP